MNKKADLTNSIVGIVIAVIAIALFVGAIIYTYQSYYNSDSEKVKRVLNLIIERAERMEEGQSSTFAIQGVEGWMLVGWNKYDSSIIKPERCFGKSCLCICKSHTTFGGADGILMSGFDNLDRADSVRDPDYEIYYDSLGKPQQQLVYVSSSIRKDLCQNSGVCREIKTDNILVRTQIKIIDEGNIDNGLPREIEKTNRKIVLRKNLMELNLFKGENSNQITFRDKIVTEPRGFLAQLWDYL